MFVPVQSMAATSGAPSRPRVCTTTTSRRAGAWRGTCSATARPSVKWNMGKYLQAAGLGGLYIDNNAARRSTNTLTRGWDDRNGNRMVECDSSDSGCRARAAQTPIGLRQPADTCRRAAHGLPDLRPIPRLRRRPYSPNSTCGRHRRIRRAEAAIAVNEAGQNLMGGWDQRREEWQIGMGFSTSCCPGCRRRSPTIAAGTTTSRSPTHSNRLRLVRRRTRRWATDALANNLNYLNPSLRLLRDHGADGSPAAWRWRVRRCRAHRPEGGRHAAGTLQVAVT